MLFKNTMAADFMGLKKDFNPKNRKHQGGANKVT